MRDHWQRPWCGRLAAAALAGALLVGCAVIKPYEKEYLLDELMDDAALAGLTPSLLPAVLGANEKLGLVTPTAAGTACPTCGG